MPPHSDGLICWCKKNADRVGSEKKIHKCDDFVYMKPTNS